mgnify:CR=1 FL=1
MLINLRDMLHYAEEKNIAVPSFNVYNVESVQAVWQAATKKDSPVIIAFGESYDSHMPIESAAALILSYVRDAQLPVVLHLDHCRSQRNILRALRAGFTSVMFDGSAKPLADNIEDTKAIVRMAHDLHVSVEGELGYMNEEDGTTILISSHILPELHQLATVYGFIHHGKMLQQITDKELDEKCRRHVHIEVDNVEKASCILDERYPESQIKVYLRNVIKVFGYNKNISDITKELVYGGVGVEKIGYEGEDLEEYYTNLLSEVKSNETA